MMRRSTALVVLALGVGALAPATVSAVAAANVVNTIAGTGAPGYSGDGGPALAATLNDPHGIAVAADGTIYFADTGNFVIRKIDTSGVITTVAGNGVEGDSGDGGDATLASMSFVPTISLSPSGDALYIADTFNNRIRKVDLTAVPPTIDTFVGFGLAGFGFGGDGGPATAALIAFPDGVAAAPDGTVWITDSNNCRIRRVSNGIIETVSGRDTCSSTGGNVAASAATWFFPTRISVSPSGDVFVVDGNDTVRRISADLADVVTVAVGGATAPGFGPATETALGGASDVVADAVGNIYIATLPRVLKVELASGLLSVFAGTEFQGYGGDGGPATDAQFNSINSVAFQNESLVIADGQNSRLRSVTLTPPPPSPDVVVTDCADPALASLTTVSGDLIIESVPGCDAISLPNLTSVTGNLVITGNAGLNTVHLAGLESVGGNLTITDNAFTGNLDFGSLTDVAGNVTIENNGFTGNLDLGSLFDVAGNLIITDNGSTSVNVAEGGAVAGNLILQSDGAGNLHLGANVTTGTLMLDLTGYDEVGGTTGGDGTSVSNATGEAVMHVTLPSGAFDQPVSFAITHLDPATLAPEEGTGANGNAATIDPVAAYEFVFGVPTLNADATLAFEVLLDGLDVATRDALIAALDAGTATLATKGDALDATFEAFPLCAAAEMPSADGCVLVEQLDAGGQPTTGTPAIVRFTGVVGHFSTWAVVIVEPIPPADTTPPEISSVTDVTVEATGPTGALVVYALPGATDETDGTVSVSCSPSSGTTFALGQTEVSCSASDMAGNVAQVTFNVIVQDTTAPTISSPGDITVAAIGPDGAPVIFVATANDAVDGATPADCTPPTGSLFPAGPGGIGTATTTVTCTKTDTHGNAATPVSFEVTVVGARDQLAALRQAVDSSDVQRGLRWYLSITLRHSQWELGRREPHVEHACRVLDHFIHVVDRASARRYWHLDATTAADWIAAARHIKAVLGCSTASG